MKNWTCFLIAMACAALLAVFASATPTPAPANAPATGFSAVRAMADVREIARAPHPTGSAENARVRDYLTRRLQSLGMSVASRTAPLDARSRKRLSQWRGSPADGVEATSLVATLPGRDPTKPALLLMAHHDSVWDSPGAGDDSAGVAAILETVRALRASGQPLERSLIVLFTDAEELGLDGAEDFFKRDPLREQVGVIINLEARGGGGRAAMFETGNDNGAMIELFANSVRGPVATSVSVLVYNNMPNFTDYTVAKKQGVPGFNFAFLGRPAQYHSATATPDALDAGSLQDMGRQTLDLSRALLAVPTLPGKSPDLVFFDLFGLLLLSYAGWIGWLILAVTVAAYGYAARGMVTVRDAERGVAIALAILLIGGLVLWLGNLVSGAGGAVNYYDRLAATPRLELQAALLCMATAMCVAGLLLNRHSMTALVPATAIPFLLLAGLAQAFAPTAAFPLYLPLLLGGAGIAIARWRPGAIGDWAMTITAAVGGGYLLTLAHALFEAVGQGMPYVAILPLALCALLLMPLVPRVERACAMKGALALGVLAMLIALWVRFDAVAASVPSYSMS
ncbi:MAG: M20/M25/M40 family metallo-hydrolase [Thermomonas sp.]|uniref:M20/M25/M40 family metallo-hydrolase n=1 Tax=Thermomonas sp. TaxID=1971895 RepID=UPI0039E62E10